MPFFPTSALARTASLIPRLNRNRLSQATQPMMAEEEPPGFYNQYKKLTSNTPNRLAFQQAVNEGAPVVNPSKGSRIAAILGGGLAGFAGGPESGVNTADYILNKPQNFATDRYNQRLKGLSQLAGMESEDIDRGVRGLQFQSDDYWKGKEFGLDKSRLAETARVNAATIENMQRDNDRQDWVEWDDVSTGQRMEYNRKTGQTRPIGRIGLSATDKFNQQLQLVDKNNAANMERERFSQGQQNYRTKLTTDASIQNTQTRADAQREVQKQRLEAAASKAAKTDTAKDVWRKFTNFINSDPELAEFNLANYIEADPETGAPYIKAGLFGDEAIAAKLRQYLAQATAGSNTTTTSTGRRYSITEVK